MRNKQYKFHINYNAGKDLWEAEEISYGYGWSATGATPAGAMMALTKMIERLEDHDKNK